jgi:hypothetical protein
MSAEPVAPPPITPPGRHPGESWGIPEERATRANSKTPAFAGVTELVGDDYAVATPWLCGGDV